MRRLRLKDHNAHMSLRVHCLGIVSRVSSLATADRRAAWLGALQVGESGLCGDTVASRTPRTLGLPSDLRSFLCKMGPAVTVSFHERQYCITNDSLGLNKAKKYVPWETFTHLGRGHMSRWQGDRVWECSDFIFELVWPLGGYPGISDLHLHQDPFLTHLFRVAGVLKMGPVSSFPLPYSSVWSFVFLVCHEEKSSDTQCWLITPTVMTISVNGFWPLEGKKSHVWFQKDWRVNVASWLRLWIKKSFSTVVKKNQHLPS